MRCESLAHDGVGGTVCFASAAAMACPPLRVIPLTSIFLQREDGFPQNEYRRKGNATCCVNGTDADADADVGMLTALAVAAAATASTSTAGVTNANASIVPAPGMMHVSQAYG